MTMLCRWLREFRKSRPVNMQITPTPPPRTGLNFRDTVPVFPSEKGNLWHTMSNACLSFGGLVGQLVVWKLNDTKIFHQENFQEAVLDRPRGTPVITASNHKAATDDWFLCTILGTHKQALSGDMRYVMGAEEVLFWTRWTAELAAIGHIMPIRRGFGVYQRAMDEAINMLAGGKWLHIYPQGLILHTKEEEVGHRLKWGIGRLVADCPTNPCPPVLPVWHIGMDDFVPNALPYRPHFGQKITMVVGKAMDFTDQVKEMRSRNCSCMFIRKTITDQVQERLADVREEALALHAARS